MENIAPFNRRLVLVVTNREHEKYKINKEFSSLLYSEDMEVLPARDMNLFRDSFTLLGDELSPGMLLCLSPYSDTEYIPIENAEVLCAQKKIALTTTFCSYLGIKSIESVDTWLDENSMAINASLEGSSGGYGGKAGVSYDKKKMIERKCEISARFKGGEAQIERAKKFLKDNRLDSDPVLNELHGIVSNEYNNIEELERTIILSSSMDSTLNIAAGIDIPSASINFNFEKVKNNRSVISTKVKIKF